MDDEVYADGTPETKSPFPVDKFPVARILEAAERKPQPHKVSANPTAAEVHMREAGAPWREKWERQIGAENRLAKEEMTRARITGLARQSCLGLEKVYGLKVDYTSFAARLTDAFKAKERMKAAAVMDLGDDGASESKSDDSKALQAEVSLLDAVMRYDLTKIATLLGLKIPDRTVKSLSA